MSEEEKHIKLISVVEGILFSELSTGKIDIKEIAEKIVLNLFYATKNTKSDGSN